MSTLVNKGYKGFGQFGIFLAMWGGGLVVGSLAALGLWLALTGRGIMNMQSDLLNPSYSGAIKSVQAISTLFMFFLPAVAFAFVCFRNGWLALGFLGRVKIGPLALSLAIIICSGPLIEALGEWNKLIPVSAGFRAWADKMEASYEQQVAAIATLRNFGQYLASLIMVAVLPALFEEVLFRGGLQNLLTRWWKKPVVALIVTSVLFSAIHGSWYGFLPRVALGMLLGGLFYITQNIWYGVLVHLLNNAMVVTYMYYLTLKGKPLSQLSEPVFPTWAAIIAVLILVALFRLLWLRFRQPAPLEVVADDRNPFAQKMPLQ